MSVKSRKILVFISSESVTSINDVQAKIRIFNHPSIPYPCLNELKDHHLKSNGDVKKSFIAILLIIHLNLTAGSYYSKLMTLSFVDLLQYIFQRNTMTVNKYTKTFEARKPAALFVGFSSTILFTLLRV